MTSSTRYPHEQSVNDQQTKSTFHPNYLPLGEKVVVVQFEKVMSVEVNQSVHLFGDLVKSAEIRGVTQVIPTFTSLAVGYDPLIISYSEMVTELMKLASLDTGSIQNKGKVVHVPVVYGGKYGPDLEYVAEQKGLHTDEVIEIHHSNKYLIYMLGVIASFPYLGELDNRLALPRRSSPRLKVESGSIAIANQQTIIVTLESPSGWYMLGRTPMETFNPKSNPPSLFLAGDYIKFEPISHKEAENWNEHMQREWNKKWNF